MVGQRRDSARINLYSEEMDDVEWSVGAPLVECLLDVCDREDVHRCLSTLWQCVRQASVRECRRRVTRAVRKVSDIKIYLTIQTLQDQGNFNDVVMTACLDDTLTPLRSDHLQACYRPCNVTVGTLLGSCRNLLAVFWRRSPDMVREGPVLRLEATLQHGKSLA